MREKTVEQLRKIAVPKVFAKNDYICYEGQPGNDMYIILRGSVGVYLTNVLGSLDQVATINEGDFFGEMAIFDNLPRSASCIALEDTVCVAVNKDNLDALLENCPDIAKQIIENLSGRIRKLDNELYQNTRFVKERHVPRFQIPAEYAYKHAIKPPFQSKDNLITYTQACPICGRAITVTDVKRNRLEKREMDLDGKVTYFQCEPLWLEIMSCPHCYYANHNRKFFRINNYEQEIIRRVLEKEHKGVVNTSIGEKGSDFDYLVVKYLQTIHINENIDPGDNVLIGTMWRNLYWLSKSAGDKRFADYCATKAIDKLKVAIENNEIFSETSKGALALSLAGLVSSCGGSKDVMQYIEIALSCPDKDIVDKAQIIKRRIEKLLKS